MKPKEIPDFEIEPSNNGNLVVHFYEEDFINTEHFATFLDIVDPLLDKLWKKHKGMIANYHAISSLRSDLSYLLAGLIENGNLTKDLNDHWVVHSYTKKTKNWQSYKDEAMGLDKFGVYKEKSYKNSYECEFISPCSTPKAPVVQSNELLAEETVPGFSAPLQVWKNQYGYLLQLYDNKLQLELNTLRALHNIIGTALKLTKPKVEVEDDEVLI